ncbi:response regulator receiver domain-containing protein [Flavobacterium aquaticum]|uniref:Response regulator receiver domain-containing protein n=1 Tax=Flavobacterium aquaticum TaxID=1236486 RepID=A0A327YNK6_9FLAO|nr:response regulator [Flavobacterium aquaticum]RAK22684.1 response regulator receiver domain-containing protein [Flavobacterium aquaticum]
MESKKIVHILLVEDNEGDILLTQDAFEESKINTEISVARNGQEALDFLYNRNAFLEAKKPDLILLDINLPIYNGHEVLKKIKQDSNLKKIPVIMLTTSAFANDINQAYENNCNSYVKKPLDMQEFLEAILKIENFWLEICTLPNE